MSDIIKENPIVQICGLWLNEKKDGSSKYMKGISGRIEYLIFKNKNKTLENQPDYYLCLSKHKTKEITEDATEEDISFDVVPF